MKNKLMNRPFFHTAAAAALTALLGACASPSYTLQPQDQAAAPGHAKVPADADFPKLGDALWVQGSFAPLEGLRAMRTGMGKDQVREALGVPHFSEGLWGVKEWNYIFHFRTGEGADYVTCQYMVRYDDNMLVSGTYWKGPNCAALANPPAPEPKVVTVEKVVERVVEKPVERPAEPLRVSLGADGLFRFDGSRPSDLLPEGHTRIDKLARDLKAQFSRVEKVRVTGHTDRLGSTAYNAALSLARASTVRDMLIERGVDGAVIQAAGLGESQPVAECPGKHKTPELVACLQPNRRVDIEVSGTR